MDTSQLHYFSNYHQQRAGKARSTEAQVQDAINSLRVREYEALYVLDCTEMEITYKSESFEVISGVKGNVLKRIDTFYNENLSKASLVGVSKNIGNRVKIIYDTNLWTHKDVHQEVVEFTNGKRMLKSSFIFMRDDFGVTTHSASLIRDVTSFIPSGYKSQFIGPNAKELNANMIGMPEFIQVLSEREIQVLFLIGKGYSSRQIGEIINISKHTVDTHRRNILKKLETNNSIEAYRKADDMGLLLNI
ncbi:response regulator transcription factor [Ekhidna sp.]|uniref:response regulator transcription factor n=1 Tax=Ekhidna sp. TaxID=2608089 RepID=UPI003CCBA754